MIERPAELAQPTAAPRVSEQRAARWIAAALAAAVVCAYAAIVRADFIVFDDNSHVFENPLVLEGLSWSGIAAAFTTFHASLWVPLTTLSFMADVSLFGLNPGAMHAVNLAWHAASTVLLFFTLRRLTGSLGVSAFAAGLFGLHPLNVESVAWIAERKSVLSTFFWLAAIAAYSRFAEKPRAGWYLASVVAALLALLAKPMAVTLPGTLLLLDFWPLQRWRTVAWWRLLVEKLPFIFLSAAASGLAMCARRESSVVTTETLSIAARVSNALVSYASYLGMLFWPADLAVFYPHPVAAQPVLAGASAALLVALSGVALAQGKKRPFLLMGWLWFLGVLVPVLGLVQVGSQARADRFTYVPQLGIFLALAWLAREQWGKARRGLWLGGGVLLLSCAALSAHQVQYWMDGATLFEHALAVTKNNPCAAANAGLHRARAGEPAAAIAHFQKTLRLQPDQPMIWREFGAALERLDKPAEAIAAYRTALHYAPGDHSARYALAVNLQRSGATEEAIARLEEILRDVPHSAGAHFRLGLALQAQGRSAEARVHQREAARLVPHDPEIVAAVSAAQPGEK